MVRIEAVEDYTSWWLFDDVLYQRRTSGGITRSKIINPVPMYSSLEILLTTRIGSYMYIDYSIRNVFKYLDTLDDVISYFIIHFEGIVDIYYMADINSILTSEDIIYLERGFLYPSNKLEIINKEMN